MTLSSKWQIARHWETSPGRGTFAPAMGDLAEPCCFACGYWSERWVRSTPRASWERASLERAHIVPASLGGPDEASNLVLFCGPCHKESPDWHEPSEMARWIANREERGSKEIADLQSWLGALKEVPDFQRNLASAGTDEEAGEKVLALLKVSATKAGIHAGDISQGTRVAIVRDAAKQLRRE